MKHNHFNEETLQLMDQRTDEDGNTRLMDLRGIAGNIVRKVSPTCPWHLASMCLSASGKWQGTPVSVAPVKTRGYSRVGGQICKIRERK